MKTKVLYSNNPKHTIFASTGLFVYMWHNTDNNRIKSMLDDLIVLYNSQDITNPKFRDFVVSNCMQIGVNEPIFATLVADVMNWQMWLLDGKKYELSSGNIVHGGSVSIKELKDKNIKWWDFILSCHDRFLDKSNKR